MTDEAWLTLRQAADLLGCHVSLLPELIRQGVLTPRGQDRGGRVARDQVEQLARARAADHDPVGPPSPGDGPPDDTHRWLTPDQVATTLGIAGTVVCEHIRSERLPAVQVGATWWIRADHLDRFDAPSGRGLSRG